MSRAKYLYIPNVPDDTKEALINISANLGIPLSALIKPELRKIIESFPPKMREPKSKD